MRVSLVLVLTLFSICSVAQFKGSVKVTGSFDNVPLETIFDSLSSQTDYFFSYSSDIITGGNRYTIVADAVPIDQFLSELFVGTGIKYSFFKDQIILNYEKPIVQEVKKKITFSISGVVVDQEGVSIPAVNVFLDGTSLGTATDSAGAYRIDAIPQGSYSIVFSHIGYENGIYQILENNGGSRIQNHQMTIAPRTLEEVQVSGGRISRTADIWLSHYMIFRREVVGLTANSERCVIENPESINFFFDDEKNKLFAYAKEPIQIRNDALGYQISYFLESFEKQLNGDLRFRGRIRFRNMEPSSNWEKRAWKNSRKRSYYGSLNHFKQALLDSDIKKQGFRIYKLKDVNRFAIDKLNGLKENDILVFKGEHYEMDFKNYLIVEYRKERESYDFLRNSNSLSILYPRRFAKGDVSLKNPGAQLSVIKLLKGSIRLDPSGEIMDRFGLSTYGYWSWERLADLVPINYDPKYDNI